MRRSLDHHSRGRIYISKHEVLEIVQGSGIARDGPGRDQKKESSGPTIEPNKLLKIFFETEDKGVVAEQYSTSLSEKFFIVLDSFMGLVREYPYFTRVL